MIYAELGIPDIVTKIKKRQFSFFRNVTSLELHEASVRAIIDMCSTLPCYQYYLNIDPKITEVNISNRRHRISLSDQMYNSRYTSMIGFSYCDCLYNSCLSESRRSIITRWRLSNHSLRIETGRYTNPYTERNNRLCTICLQIENEEHAIFLCRLYDGIRAKYYEIFSRYNVVNEFLNPRNVNDAYTIGSFLRELENIREAFYEDRK